MTKKLALVLASCLILGACASQADAAQGDPQSAPSASQTASDASTPDPASADRIASEPSAAESSSSGAASSDIADANASDPGTSASPASSEPFIPESPSPNLSSVQDTASSASPLTGGTLQAWESIPVLTVSPETAPLGEVFTLRVSNAAELKVSVETNLPFTPKFFPLGQDQIALLPVSYNLSPGVYSLTVNADGTVFHHSLSVTDREFEVQHLTIDPSVSGSTNTPQGNAQWEQLIEPLKYVSDPQQYWEGLFLYPVPGEEQITTEFGLSRYTNGSSTAVRHSGIDIAAPAGADIIAPNHGVVQFAGNLILTGNTIVIEHGLGLKSLYYHMDSVAVAAGDTVTKGQIIGAVGSTGYSTGPHLHFAMAVNNVFVNPWTAFDTPYLSQPAASAEKPLPPRPATVSENAAS